MATTRILALAGWIALAGLSGCGGDGDAPAPPPAPKVGTLFLSDGTTGDVATFPTLVPTGGTPFANGVVATLSAFYAGSYYTEPMVYDAVHDELYVGVFNAAMYRVEVQVFPNARQMNPGAAPARIIDTIDLQSAHQLFYDAASDTLQIYGIARVSIGSATDALLVTVPNASTASGIMDSLAQQGYDADGFYSTIAIDSGRDIRYVTQAFSDDVDGIVAPGIQVIENASGGTQAATRVIGASISANDVALDASRDILYVTDDSGLWIFQHASTATPTAVGPLALSTAGTVAVDAANDRLYVAASQKLYVLENASALTAHSALPTPAVVDQASPSSGIIGIAFQ